MLRCGVTRTAMQMRQIQKERLISLCLSVFVELAIRLSEKESLTLFFEMAFLFHLHVQR